MKIKNKLSIQFAGIVASILIVFSFSIYYSSSNYRQIQYQSRLKDALKPITDIIKEENHAEYLYSDKINSLDINLYNSNVNIYRVTNDNFFPVHGIKESISDGLLKDIKSKKELYFNIGQKEGYGSYINGGNQSFLAIITAEDIYGKSKLNNLIQILIIAFFLSVILTSYIAWIYAAQALKPISVVVNEVDNITANNLYSRVKEGNGKDEIAYLAVTFNKMLERLENAFKMQRSFVSNASHELRTPLTTISGEIEVALLKERKIEDYKAVLLSIHEEIKNLSKLSNGLLELAQVSVDINTINKEYIRVDELLWQSRSELMKHKKHYDVQIFFDENLDDDQKLTILGNEQLIKSTFFNLMENSCKYSKNNTVEVRVGFENKQLKISFCDQGIGISKEELKHIFEPFYRAENALNIEGHGIGLPLVDKIMQIHHASIKIDSQVNCGTTVHIGFPIYS